MLLSSGDNFLAGFVFNSSLETGTFYDALALDRLGYDALCLGNHDFDFGTEVLADFIGSYTLTTPPYNHRNRHGIQRIDRVDHHVHRLLG